MLCTALLLFTALLSVLCFHNYVRFLFRDTRRRYMRRRARRLLSISTPGNTSTTAVGSKGLDSSVIKTIPTIVYASHFPALECAVCLSEFENDERARVLPECNHTFHVDCIDMWFYSHSNCPLCRAPVQAVNPVNPQQTAGSEPSSSSSSLELELESCPMQKLELVGIVVEVPTATGAPGGIGFR
ncbi:hypothetical protein V6N13_079576 [Hibiscus sabdariffa]